MNPRGSLQEFLSVWVILILIAGIFSSGCATDLTGTYPARSHEAANSGDLRIYFLDVGQGDASLIRYHDTVILIDAGEVDQGDQVVHDLRKLGVDHIDLLVASHPHSDHIGGMQEVLDAFPVDKVLDSGLPHTSMLYERFLETVNRKGIRYMIAEQGQKIDLNPSLSILILSPPKERLEGDLNTNSIVLKISHARISFLFTGDAGAVAENELIRAGYSPEAQILKVAHHGSSDASSATFLSRVRPEVAVISLSRDNPYGYPHRETLDALQTAAGPSIFRTDRDGTVLIQSNGTTYSVTTENGQEGVWKSTFSSYATPGPGTTAPPVFPSSAVTAIATISVLHQVPANITPPTVTPMITIPVPIPPVQIGNVSLVKIETMQFNAPGDDRKNLNGEWVRITNRGEEPVLMAGWTLSDISGAGPYTFPAYLLLSRESVTVYSGTGRMNDTSLFMGRTDPLWGNNGDTAFLRDGSGTLIDSRSGGSS